jgi:hypothetical protein
VLRKTAFALVILTLTLGMSGTALAQKTTVLRVVVVRYSAPTIDPNERKSSLTIATPVPCNHGDARSLVRTASALTSSQPE